MDKRSFLKTSTALVAGTALSRLAGCTPDGKPLSNWSGNLEYSTSNVFYPATVEAVQEAVKQCAKVRGLGSRHSFNTIADSNAAQISTSNLNRIVSLDKAGQTVTVEAGIKYGELCQHLHDNGFALHNLASLPHISVAGSCATATHGSGVKNGNLSTQVVALEFVNGAGEVVNLSAQDGDRFQGAVVGLGALGIVTKMTLALQPTFDVQQVVYRNLPMAALEKNFEAIMSSGYSVSLFTDWKNKNVNEVWIKSRVTAGQPVTIAPEFFGAKAATQNMHPIEDQPAGNCTEQMGVPGPWFERLPHFKMGFTPSAGKELQSEFFVPLEHGYAAMMAMETLHEKIAPHIFISEIRTIDADNFWMSPCYKKPCVALHTTWKQNRDGVMALLPLIEEQLAPFNPRPHWGKLFTLTPAVLQSRIERLDDFRQLMKQYDPEQKFVNDFLKSNLSIAPQA
ncbi:FAD-binding protein [Chryseolinea lacunae]|uniref:FAD-binding protein n=1 Tax=Chryseolinea lacunae TaxID=2801331 RepID=A0ABS1KLR6_9BACT|nr:FAD-binding protein [Chryseolinea lacunae]MBL0740386.1 FAD-binding protein [Chryseolinea lacunae]